MDKICEEWFNSDQIKKWSYNLQKQIRNSNFNTMFISTKLSNNMALFEFYDKYLQEYNNPIISQINPSLLIAAIAQFLKKNNLLGIPQKEIRENNPYSKWTGAINVYENTIDNYDNFINIIENHILPKLLQTKTKSKTTPNTPISSSKKLTTRLKSPRKQISRARTPYTKTTPKKIRRSQGSSDIKRKFSYNFNRRKLRKRQITKRNKKR